MPLFAASHMNYAQYGLYYLRTMEQLPDDVCEHFQKGEHTMHHNSGIFSGIWSDMAIETTLMRYGHGQSGIIGELHSNLILSNTWAYSMHACNTLVINLDEMRQQDHNDQITQVHHKEEGTARIKLDTADRRILQEKLQNCINPLSETDYPKGLVNIVTGQVVSSIDRW